MQGTKSDATKQIIQEIHAFVDLNGRYSMPARGIKAMTPLEPPKPEFVDTFKSRVKHRHCWEMWEEHFMDEKCCYCQEERKNHDTPA